MFLKVCFFRYLQNFQKISKLTHIYIDYKSDDLKKK